MKKDRSDAPLIAIVGPTASGKTGLAVRLAAEYGGEIICADSRTVYRGLDIGTAKPTAEEQRLVPHWGIDLVDPGERFTVADFKEYAVNKIAEIRARGHVPFLVGGTGLYVNAVVYDYQFPSEVDMSIRRRYESMSLPELYEYCEKNNVKLPENNKNKRHVVNAILRKGQEVKRRIGPSENTYVVGISTSIQELKERIRLRAHEIWTSNVMDEAQQAAQKFGWDNEAMTGNIYPLIKKVIDGEMTTAEARERFVVLDRQLAKRQMTWLKRDKHITWLSREDAYVYCAQLLDKLNKPCYDDKVNTVGEDND